MATGEQFALNGIDKTDEIMDLHLANFGGQYVLELLGKTGEPRAYQAVHLSLKLRDFRQPVEVDLQTSPQGQILLGALDGIDSLTATGPVKSPRTWKLQQERRTSAANLNGQAGQPLEIPYLTTAAEPTRDELSLLELRGDQYRGGPVRHIEAGERSADGRESVGRRL